MAHWRKLMNNDHLGSWDLEDEKGGFKQVIVTIESFTRKEANLAGHKQDKVFVKFKEFSKQMICNKDNFKRLEKKFGTYDHEQYIGKQVVLGVEKVNSPEGKVDGLRFSSRNVPTQQKKKIKPERFEEAIAAMKAGNFSTDGLKDYELTAEQQKQIDDLKQ